MNTRELIESAAMDTLGLLSQEEREQFENALRIAPPHVQAEVRREQLRTAEAEHILLPEVAPPAGLRFKVLAAVREAINRTAPRNPAEEHGARNRSIAAFISSAAAWRVAAIALASATVTLAIFNLAFQHEARRLQQQQSNFAQLQYLDTLGQKFPDLVFAQDRIETSLGVNPNAALPPAGEATPEILARAMTSESVGSAVLILKHLPVTDARYRVVLLDEQGNEQQQLHEFTATGTAHFISLNMDVTQINRIAVVGPTQQGGTAEVLLAARFA